MHDDDYDDDSEFVSKTSLKKAMAALQELGESLVKLTPAQLDKFPLENSLREAIELAQKMKQGNGRRRQLQYIGKLMRSSDHEAIATTLAKLHQQHSDNTYLLHQAETWRDRMVDEGTACLGEFINQYPHTERQNLNQLVRAAAKERQQIQAAKEASQTPPPAKHYRKLFKQIRDIIGEE